MEVWADTRISNTRMDNFVSRDRALQDEQLRGGRPRKLSTSDSLGIVGGMERGFAHVRRCGFNSNVDFVIDASAASVTDLATAEGTCANTVGGYSFDRGD